MAGNPQSPCRKTRLKELSVKAQPLARIVDHEPPSSTEWKLAATKLAVITKESLALAHRLGQKNILDIAQSAAARVRNQCPVEAEKVGL
jgi:hypothetical protein